MTSTAIKKFLGGMMIALVSVTVLAQPDTVAMEDANQKLEEIFTEVNAFTSEVRFGAEDVESLIDLWAEYEELGGTDDEETIDFDAILADSRYRSWASSHGLVAEDWLRKTARISMVLYREQMLEAAAEMPDQMRQQMEMIEQQRDQVGEEIYEQMKASMEASVQYAEMIAEQVKLLPVPTAAEAAVLDEYREVLITLMMDDDEDYEDYEDDEDYEDYEDDEDYQE